MKKPAIIGFYGKSKTGKTTLIVKIIKRLTTEGLKIATIKITDKNIGVDTDEKDTWKYGKAGSELVIFSSPMETDFLYKKNMESSKILNFLEDKEDYDIILVEGARDKNIPKIRLGNIIKRENTLITYDGNFERLMEIINSKIRR